MNKLQELKEYIQKEIPEISDCPVCGSEKGVFKCSRVVRNCADCMQYVGEIKISLEDVLRVIDKQKKLVLIDSVGAIRNDKLEQLSYWKLGKTIDDQSEEIIEFLYNLIIKQKKYYEM